MISIKTNLSSLVAQNNLLKSTNSLNTSIERMTTGFKINHAKDDAANYSISKNLDTKISSFEVAEQNVAMGSDMLTTAEENIDLITSHLQRIKDLCEQAANGTYDETSRNAMQAEIDARVKEIKRIKSTTEYNGIDLLERNEFIVDIVEETPDIIVTDPTQLASAISSNSKVGIGNAETLAKLAELVNSGTSCSGKTIILTEDIDLSAYQSGTGWTPIDDFRGTFNGNGHVIKNLYINNPTANYQGLFGYAKGVIKNVGIANCNVTGGINVGGLAGYTSKKIDNCYVTGDITGTGLYTGGLVGFSETLVKNCYATADVTGTTYVGGLVGYAFSALSNCYATGDVTGNTSIGGLVGEVNGGIDISNCYATGDINGNKYVGGFAGSVFGSSYGDYSTSYSTGTAVGDSFNGLTNNITTEALNAKIEAGELPKSSSSTATKSITLQVGINDTDSDKIEFETGLTISGFQFNVSTVARAKQGLDKADKMLSSILDRQTGIGAVQNRLESAADSIATTITNYTTSRSTIKDADVATESSRYIQQQILQQAATTLLATANQSPSIALQLI